MLLVGGSGFLGSHIRAILRKVAQPCTIVSRDPSRVQKDLSSNERVLDYGVSESDAAIALETIRSVVYLTGGSSPGANPDSVPNEISRSVVPAVADLLRFSQFCPNAIHILVSSGGAIYGNTDKELVEETEPARPISPYGLGKLFLEESLTYASRKFGFQFRILRVSNAVGIHHSSLNQGLVAAALRAAAQDQPFSLFGDGSAVRDYVHADDVAEAILLAAESVSARSGIWNIGSGVGHSIIDILTIVERTTGKSVHVLKKDPRVSDVARIVLNCRKASVDFNWRAHRNLESAIQELWQKSNTH